MWENKRGFGIWLNTLGYYSEMSKKKKVYQLVHMLLLVTTK